MAESAPAPTPHLLHCDHFDAGRCRSCTWLTVPLADQVARKVAQATNLIGVPSSHLLQTSPPALVWDPPATQPVAGFRNKAKMAIGGTVESPTLGLVALDGSSTDLRDCALHSPGLVAALPVLAEFLTRARLEPYRLDLRRGELKHVVVTESLTGALMVRFVLRSTEPESRIRKHLGWLQEALPLAQVISLNIQPEHKAVLEGSREITLTEQAMLPMPVAGLNLNVRPQGFFQTSSLMAAELYATAARWCADLQVRDVWDLYSGVGGFAMALAAPGREVLGVEISPEAVAAATASAPAGVRFTTGDATAFAVAAAQFPDLVVVNPPRRGIGPELADWLEHSAVPYVLYSSCNVETLAQDLIRMSSLRPVRGRVLDMFPNTAHHEVLVLLTRAQPGARPIAEH